MLRELFVPAAHAQFSASCPGSGLPESGQLGGAVSYNPLCPITGEVTLATLIDRLITILLYIAGALAVIYLLYSGILYITAGGDETKAQKARQGIVNAVIGIIIIVLAFVIEKAAANIFVT